MSYWSEFKKLTKKYVKDNADLRKKYNVDDDDEPEPSTKRVEREEESEEKPAPAPAPAKPAAPAKSAKPAAPAKPAKPTDEEDTNWSCVGRVWEDPAVPCQGGPKANQRCGIKHDGGRVRVCKECYNARERKKNQEKRDAKRAKIQNALEGQ